MITRGSIIVILTLQLANTL